MINRKLTALLFFLLYALTVSSQVFINEFMASNRSAYWDNDLKSYSDWIELYNAGPEKVDIGGYYITDNLNRTRKWTIATSTIIEAKGYLVLWADNGIEGSHLGFALNIDIEEIGLYTSNLEPVDIVEYSGQHVNVSYGRCLDGAADWCYFGEHSAGRTNGKDRGAATITYAAKPEFSLHGGLYAGDQLIRIKTIAPSIIRYTTDGSDVRFDAPTYSQAIHIANTTVIKAKSYVAGKLPSATVSNTYFIDEIHKLPIFSISTDGNNLWDPDIGIYINGSGYDGEDWRTANYQQFWHRPAFVEYYSTQEGLRYSSNAELKVFGSFTSRYGQKPLTLYFEEPAKTRWNIFKLRGVTPYRSLVLRNSGQDWIRTMICDGLFNSLVMDVMDIDAQAYKPSVLYINGDYWGIHNIREKVNEEHFGNLYNVDPTRILLQKRLGSTGQAELDSLLSYVQSHDMSLSANMKRVREFMEVDEYLNYMVAELYSANMDWPKNNVRMWKKEGSEGKWRWILVDLDVSMGIWSNARFDANSLSRILDSVTVNTELFRALMQNQNFKEDLIQRSALLLNTVFSVQRVNHFIDSLSNNIAAEMPRHVERWKDSCSWSCGLASMEDWHHFLNKMRYFADQRPKMMKANLMKRFELEGEVEITFKADNGRIVVNSCDIPFDPSGSFFSGVPIQITAIPNPGYSFDGWNGIQHEDVAMAEFTPSDSSVVEALFVPTRHIPIPNRISSDTVLISGNYPYYLDGTLTVDSGVTLTISQDVRLLMHHDANIIVRGGLKINGTEEEPVMFRANEFTGSTSWGAITFESASHPSVLSYVVIEDATHGIDKMRNIAAVNAYSSHLIVSNCTINNVYKQPVYAEYGHTEIYNSTMHTRITSDIINLKYGSGLVEGCDLRGNNEPNTDGIDFDGIIDGVIRDNHIYGFKGGNSDGIDLGEACENVLVEGNHILNCFDKGISVGQASTTDIIRNVIIGCAQGIGIKDSGSYARIDQNIFYKDSVGVACFEKIFGRGGGKAKVTNCVFSQSVISEVSKDKLSKLKVSYSISDTDILKGIGNAYARPRFNAPDDGDFSVLENSPCINQSKAFSVLDLNQTRSYGDRMLSRKSLQHSLIIMLLLWIIAVIASTSMATIRKF